MAEDIRSILEQVKSGALSVDEALLRCKEAPFEDIGFAKVDHHRRLRQGAAEVIYGAGKTPEQIAGIVEALRRAFRCFMIPLRASALWASFRNQKPAAASSSPPAVRATCP